MFMLRNGKSRWNLDILPASFLLPKKCSCILWLLLQYPVNSISLCYFSLSNTHFLIPRNFYHFAPSQRFRSFWSTLIFTLTCSNQISLWQRLQRVHHRNPSRQTLPSPPPVAQRDFRAYFQRRGRKHQTYHPGIPLRDCHPASLRGG